MDAGEGGEDLMWYVVGAFITFNIFLIFYLRRVERQLDRLTDNTIEELKIKHGQAMWRAANEARKR